jgi:hypothetical protein
MCENLRGFTAQNKADKKERKEVWWRRNVDVEKSTGTGAWGVPRHLSNRT